jgi:hypothetical protein
MTVMGKVFFIILIIFSYDATADIRFCAQAPVGRHVEVKYAEFETASQERLSSFTVKALRYEFDAILLKKEFGESNLFIGAGHRYTPFDFERLEPLTNGDLHTIYLPIHLVKPVNQGVFHFAASPALSVSSNVLKNLDLVHKNDLQLWLAAAYEYPLSEKVNLLLGLCADHRFGHYRAYPVAGIKWSPTENWIFRLSYPDVEVSYWPFARFKLSFSVSPDGNEWHVYDKSLSRSSYFQYESVRAEIGGTWLISKAFSLGLSAGKQFNNYFRFMLADNSRITTETGTISFVSLTLDWAF